ELWHRRRRLCQDQRHRRDDRSALARFFRDNGQCRRLFQEPRFPQGLHSEFRQQESRNAALTPVVTLRGIGKRFRSGVAALEGIDLDIGNGEFLSLLGPSGCGKTTLLRIIAGLAEPSEGERRLSLAADGTGRIPSGRVGFVFQDPTLSPWATGA